MPIPLAPSAPRIPSGPGAAAILAASIGALALGIFTLLGDKAPAVRKLLIFYKPTGPLSGVTDLAILLWLLAWAVLHWRWKSRDVPLKPVLTASFVLLALGFLLTFPPVIDLF